MSKYKKTKASREKFKRATVKNEIGYENTVPVWMFDKNMMMGNQNIIIWKLESFPKMRRKD